MNMKNVAINKILTLFALMVFFQSFNLGQNSDTWHKEDLGCIDKKQGFIPISSHFFDGKSGLIVGETGEIESKAFSVFIKNSAKNCMANVWMRPSSFDDVFFANRNQGWIVGSEVSSENLVEGILLETSNGGKTWSNKKLNQLLIQQGYNESDFDAIYFTQNGNGFILGKVKKEENLRGIIINTKDRENHWEIIYQAEEDLFFEDISFDSSGKIGWITTNRGFILNTVDGGKNWKRQNTNLEVPLLKLMVLNSEEVWVTSQSSTILHTLDGGKSWKIIPISVNSNRSKKYTIWFSGIFFDKFGNGWISGSGGIIMRTRDFGKTWKEESFGKAEFLYEIVSTGDNIIALGRPSVLLLRDYSKNQ